MYYYFFSSCCDCEKALAPFFAVFHYLNNEFFRENKEGTAWSLVQRMVDLIASHYGTSQAHHALLFACLEGNRPIFAARILKVNF